MDDTPYMEVTVSVGDVSASVCAPGSYQPDVLDDLAKQAVRTLVTTIAALREA